MCIFTIDLVLRSWCQAKYLYSFFFWLDLVSVGSMVLDVMPLFQGSGEGGEAEQLQLARAGRAARAGTKIGRLLRLLRMVRVLKLFFMARKKGSMQQQESKEYTPSELGKELKARISQKTIVFILVLLLGSTLLTLPFLDILDSTTDIALGQVCHVDERTPATCVTDAHSVRLRRRCTSRVSTRPRTSRRSTSCSTSSPALSTCGCRSSRGRTRCSGSR